MERDPYNKLDLCYFRLLALEAGYHKLKTFSRLGLQSLKLIIRKLKSFSQLVCKINEKIHH
jgi:hypothetical protein